PHARHDARSRAITPRAHYDPSADDRANPTTATSASASLPVIEHGPPVQAASSSTRRAQISDAASGEARLQPDAGTLPRPHEALVTRHDESAAPLLTDVRSIAPMRSAPVARQERRPATTDGIETQFGGIFYLLNVALALGLYGDFTMPRAPGIALSPWDWLALVGLAWFGRDVERDPVWALLADLAGRAADESPGGDFTPSDIR